MESSWAKEQEVWVGMERSRRGWSQVSPSFHYHLPERPLLCYTLPCLSVKGPLVIDKGSASA